VSEKNNKSKREYPPVNWTTLRQACRKAGKILAKFVRRIYRKSKRVLVKFGPHVAHVIFLILLITSASFLIYAILPFPARDLTTTVTTATESLSFSLKKGMPLSWVLPPGEFLGKFRDDDDPQAQLGICKNQLDDIPYVEPVYLCNYPKPTRLVVDGPADVTLEVTPGGRWSVTIIGKDDPKFRVRVLNSEDKILSLLETYEKEFRFATKLREGSNTGTRTDSIRLAIIAASGVIGSDVHYASNINNGISNFWQPILLAGDVTTFGINLPGKGKYQIHSDRLDTGDIIEIDTEINALGQGSDDTIWGVASIGKRVVVLPGSTEVDQFVIHAVLQTTHRDLSVKRFGSPKGYQIKAPWWSIISRWPNGQQYWVALISVVLILTFGLQLGDSIRERRSKKRKKRKKHQKHKSKEDERS